MHPFFVWLTAAGLVNLTYDAAAKAFNPEHEDKADGIAVVASTSTGTAIIIQNTINGDEIVITPTKRGEVEQC